ncbi:MAG: hypothetical protein ACKOEC_07165, partial [Acidimicrobiia bacterium]
MPGCPSAIRPSRGRCPHSDCGSNRRCTLVSATKGIEEGSLLRMSQVLRQELPGSGEIVVLSGPSFARELAK